jgi:plastocyanin
MRGRRQRPGAGLHGHRRGSALLAGVLLAVAVLAGCGGEGSADTPAAPSTVPGVGEVTIADDGVQEVTIQTQDDYVFTPDRFTVAPGKVRLTVVNVAKEMTHNLRFSPGEGPEPIGSEISLLAPGQEETIEFVVTVPGDHEFACTFHTQLGQYGTMTVSG